MSESYFNTLNQIESQIIRIKEENYEETIQFLSKQMSKHIDFISHTIVNLYMHRPLYEQIYAKLYFDLLSISSFTEKMKKNLHKNYSTLTRRILDMGGISLEEIDFEDNYENKFWFSDIIPGFYDFYDLSVDRFKMNKEWYESGTTPNTLSYIIKNDDVTGLQERLSRVDINGTFSCRYIGKERVSLINISAFFGSLRCFTYLFDSNAFFDKRTLNYAVKGGNMDIILKLTRYHCKFDNSLINADKWFRTDVYDYISQYSDASASKFKVCGFCLVNLMKKNKLSLGDLKNCLFSRNTCKEIALYACKIGNVRNVGVSELFNFAKADVIKAIFNKYKNIIPSSAELNDLIQRGDYDLFKWFVDNDYFTDFTEQHLSSAFKSKNENIIDFMISKLQLTDYEQFRREIQDLYIPKYFGLVNNINLRPLELLQRGLFSEFESRSSLLHDDDFITLKINTKSDSKDLEIATYIVENDLAKKFYSIQCYSPKAASYLRKNCTNLDISSPTTDINSAIALRSTCKANHFELADTLANHIETLSA